MDMYGGEVMDWCDVKVIKYEDGTKRWFKNGTPHRDDGPAIEFANGDKYWYINGEKGRFPGPAVELANGDKYWYINGRELTEREVEAARHAEAWLLNLDEREQSARRPFCTCNRKNTTR